MRSVAKANRTSAEVGDLDRQRPHGAFEIVIHFSDDPGHDLPIEPPLIGDGDVDQRWVNGERSVLPQDISL